MNASIAVARRRIPLGAMILITVAALSASSINAVHAQETTSALVTSLYDGRWPDKDAVAQLNKERLYQQALRPT
jgi:hypothetical protein